MNIGDNMYEVAIKLLNEINNLGYDSYIVGGYSRDKYMGIFSDDIDICTSMTPDVMKKYFEVTHSFEKYGSMRILYDSYTFEVTTFRKDGEYKDRRRPETVEFVSTLEEDLKRRDFIMNTLCIDKNGNYIDILGARKDIDNKIIRVVGDVNQKLSEDPLRIIRALRFKIELNFEVDNEIIEYIENNKYLLNYLQKEKINEEINKIKNKEKKIIIEKLLNLTK